MTTEVDNDINVRIERGILAYACGRFINCTHCDAILDCKQSVLVKGDNRPMCIDCYHRDGFNLRNPAEYYGPYLFSSMDILDAERFVREWQFAHPYYMAFDESVFVANENGSSWFTWNEWTRRGTRERMIARYGERLMILSMHDDANKVRSAPIRNKVRADEVAIGKVYSVRLRGRLVNVRIEREEKKATYGRYGSTLRRNWIGTNLSTGNPVRIRSASKLRGEVKGR